MSDDVVFTVCDIPKELEFSSQSARWNTLCYAISELPVDKAICIDREARYKTPEHQRIAVCAATQRLRKSLSDRAFRTRVMRDGRIAIIRLK